MTVTLALSPDIERRLREQAALGGKTLEQHLAYLAEQSVVVGNGTKAALPLDQWVDEWRAWTANHRTSSQIADDSRESIYAGRGE